MTSSTAPTDLIESDNWEKATWEKFLAVAGDARWAQGRFYYEQGQMRVEMSPIGTLHSHSNSIVSLVIMLFAGLRKIRVIEFANASLRQQGVREFQPDLSYYLGERSQKPVFNSSPINLDECNPPELVVEIGVTSLEDDLGKKRLLYESASVKEYWVVNARDNEVIAFSMAEGRSGRIQESLVLPGLAIAIVEEALRRGETQDDGEILRWLIQSFN